MSVQSYCQVIFLQSYLPHAKKKKKKKKKKSAIGQLSATYLMWVAVNFLHFTLRFTARFFLHLSHSAGFATPCIRCE